MFHVVLYLLSVTVLSFNIATWIEPTIADWVIRHLNARRHGMRASRAAYREAYDAALNSSSV